MSYIEEGKFKLEDDEKEALKELFFSIDISPYYLANELGWQHKRAQQALIGLEPLPFVEVHEEDRGRRVARYYSMDRTEWRKFF